LAGQNGSSPTLLPPQDVDPAETQEWLDSLEYVLKTRGPERGSNGQDPFLLVRLEA
jgi:pyruvate dehydrogenase complex dehydrogenase (E1) component